MRKKARRGLLLLVTCCTHSPQSQRSTHKLKRQSRAVSAVPVACAQLLYTAHNAVLCTTPMIELSHVTDHRTHWTIAVHSQRDLQLPLSSENNSHGPHSKQALLLHLPPPCSTFPVPSTHQDSTPQTTITTMPSGQRTHVAPEEKGAISSSASEEKGAISSSASRSSATSRTTFDDYFRPL